MKYFFITFIIFQGSCFAEQKFKKGEDENNYTRKESVQYLKKLLDSDAGFKEVYMQAKNCIKKRDFKCLIDPRNENKEKIDDHNDGFDSRNLEILEQKLNCDQYRKNFKGKVVEVINGAALVSKAVDEVHRLEEECINKVRAGMKDFTPPWDLFDTAVSESNKVDLMVKINEGKMSITIFVYDPVEKREALVLNLYQGQGFDEIDYKKILWRFQLLYSGPQG